MWKHTPSSNVHRNKMIIFTLLIVYTRRFLFTGTGYVRILQKRSNNTKNRKIYYNVMYNSRKSNEMKKKSAARFIVTQTPYCGNDCMALENRLQNAIYINTSSAMLFSCYVLFLLFRFVCIFGI